MLLSYNWLKSYFAKPLPKPEKLAELLTFHTVEIESVEKAGKDFVLSADTLPNRAHDLNSHIGMANEIAVLTNQRITKHSFDIAQDKESRIKEDKSKKTATMLSVRIEDPKGCPRYIGRYIENVAIKPSPKWLRERLESCGMRAINNVVDATNYVMLEYGQPLHAFDASLVTANSKTGKKEIIVRKAKKGETFTTLDDQQFALEGSELLIADPQKSLALAGIKGGKQPGISSETKNLILEAANFDPALIRRTSRKLNLITDSSKQFAGGLHPALAEKAMARLVSLICELAGGKVCSGAIDIYPRKADWPEMRIAFDPIACNALLGTALKETEIKKTLFALGCKLVVKSGKWLIIPPVERLDLATPEDLYEEVGRIHGWENVKPEPPHGAIVPSFEEPVFKLADFARKTLAGIGYSEHVGYSLVKDDVAELFKKSGFGLLEIANPLVLDTRYLRPVLLSSLLASISANAKRFETVRVFEIGKTFFPKNDGSMERWSLGISVYLKKEAFHHEAWLELKGVVDALLKAAGIEEAAFTELGEARKEMSHPLYDVATMTEIISNDEPIGNIAMVSKKVLDISEIDGVTAYAYISLDALLSQSLGEREFADIPKFPPIDRDIAVLVPKGTKVEQVENIIQREGGELLWDADIFDIYEGAGVGEGLESLAFRLTFQSIDRTLRDEEVNKLMEKIVAALKIEGWGIRE
jgi:phenylalanyl-tRNA synthetase beta chain